MSMGKAMDFTMAPKNRSGDLIAIIIEIAGRKIFESNNKLKHLVLKW